MHILLGFADWKLQWQLSRETLLPLPGAIKTKPVWAGFSLLSKKKKMPVKKFSTSVPTRYGIPGYQVVDKSRESKCS